MTASTLHSPTALDARLAPLNGATSLRLGPLVVALLPPETLISDERLRCGLHPDEERHAAKFGSPSRRAEFLRSRFLARYLGGAAASLLPDAEGVPAWPPDLQGSITHKDGLVAIVLDSTRQYRSFGLDAEQVAKVHTGLESKILTDADLAVIERSVTRHPAPAKDATRSLLVAAVFSFKEALFKAHFPLGRRMFWFHDAETEAIKLNDRRDGGRLAMRVLVDTSPVTPKGFVTEGYFQSIATSRGHMVMSLALVPS